VLLQSELDIAFGFLRLADAEKSVVLREKVRLLQDAIYAVARRRQQDVRLH
jgi:hypothetical protein